MFGLHWLLRASRWSRNPPSARRVAIVLGVIAICVVIYLLDRYDLWPDWARLEPVRGRGRVPVGPL